MVALFGHPVRPGEPPMILPKLPDPLDAVLANFTALVDARQRDLVVPLFVGLLLAHGRRTATSWFRAAGITDDFRRGYHLLYSLGRQSSLLAGMLFSRLRRQLDPGP